MLQSEQATKLCQLISDRINKQIRMTPLFSCGDCVGVIEKDEANVHRIDTSSSVSDKNIQPEFTVTFKEPVFLRPSVEVKSNNQNGILSYLTSYFR